METAVLLLCSVGSKPSAAIKPANAIKSRSVGQLLLCSEMRVATRRI